MHNSFDRTTFDSHPAMMFVIDPADGSFVDVNPAAERFYGWPRAELRGKPIGFVNVSSPEQISGAMHDASDGKRNSFHFEHRRANGEHCFVEVHSGPVVFDGRELLISIVIDETPRILAERALARRERLYEMLSATNQAVLRAVDRAGLLAEVCRIAVERGGFRFAWVGSLQADGRVLPEERSGEDGGYIDHVRSSLRPGDPHRIGPTAQAIMRGEPVIVNDFLANPLMAQLHDAARAANVAASAAFPLREDGLVIGTLNLYSVERGFFAEAEVATLLEMASDVSFGLDKLTGDARRLAAEARAEKWSGRLESYLEDSPTISYAIEVHAEDSHVEWVSRNAEQILGYTLAEMLEPGWWAAHVHPDDLLEAQRESSATQRTGTARLEYRFLTKRGDVVWILDTSRFTPDPAGAGGRIIGSWTDVTERHRASEALRESEERLRLALSSARQGLYDLDLTTGDAIVSPEYATMLGLDPATFRETNAAWRARLHPEDEREVFAAFEDYVAGRTAEYRVEFRQRTADGRWLWVLSVGGIAKRAPDGRPLRMVGTHTDISELKESQAALRVQSAALESAADAIVITDPNGVIEWANPAFTTLTGYAVLDAVGRNPRELVKSGVQDRAFYESMWRTLLEGNVWRGELVNRRRDGTDYPELMTITPVRDETGGIRHFIAIKRDITEERTLRANLLQAQKMESIGRLAGGVAHDFNNLLTVIGGSVEFALTQVDEVSPIHSDLLEIQRAADRAAALTRQLLAFSRRQILRRSVVNLNSLVGDLAKMLVRLIGEDVLLHTELAASLGEVLADPGQLEQVVMNLVVNARDAMPTGGTLTITTENVALTAADVARDGDLAPGPYVRLRVGDTGVGMDAVTLQRIFEPFFTTKEPGKGTGLGLSTVYGIVRQSGGAIRVLSAPGQGSTFILDFPRASAGEAAVPAVRALADAAKHRGTILVVDDEEALRTISVRILARAGFTAIAAASAEEALRLVDEGATIDLVLTDVVMPGMNGPELATTLRRRRPGLKVLFTSGFTDDMILRHGVDESTMEFLPKPFKLDELVCRVAKMLGD